MSEASDPAVARFEAAFQSCHRHNFPYEDEPLDPLEPGRYLVQVSTPHIHGGCHATTSFVVTE